LLLMMMGCTSLPKLPTDLTPRVELTETPFFPQEAYQCGPAALATVLNYYQIQVTPDELRPQVYLPERKGSLQIELAAAARRYGLLAYPFGGDLNALLKELAAGNPVLVLQNLTFDWLPKWHYAVVIGYDLSENQVILRSGKHRRWHSDLRAFRNTWQRAGNWALVIQPPERIPATAQPATLLKAAFDLQTTGNEKAALTAYAAATTRWPADKRPWLALGNGAFKLDRLGEARQALKRAAVLDPMDPTALNNLAYVYLAAGCPDQARKTIQQALQLKPEDNNLQDSKQEIQLRSSHMLDGDCRLD
jgi:tetratricopeptide (TPR) repeat protein